MNCTDMITHKQVDMAKSEAKSPFLVDRLTARRSTAHDLLAQLDKKLGRPVTAKDVLHAADQALRRNTLDVLKEGKPGSKAMAAKLKWTRAMVRRLSQNENALREAERALYGPTDPIRFGHTFHGHTFHDGWWVAPSPSSSSK